MHESREEEPYLTVGGMGGVVTEHFLGEVKSGRRHKKANSSLERQIGVTRSGRKTQQSLKFTPNYEFFPFCHSRNVKLRISQHLSLGQTLSKDAYFKKPK